MERVGALINRLQEQYQQNASADKMLVTLQILAAELEQERSKQVQSGKGVSVTAPAFLKSREIVEEPIKIPTIKPVITVTEFQPKTVEANNVEIPALPKPAAPVVEVQPKTPEIAKTEMPVEPKLQQPFSYNPVKDIPTAAVQQQKEVYELNAAIGGKGESVNERLKTNGVDLGASLQFAPVKDLKRAIGINDRYVFLNELFRGDEVMYERSIKTINAFSIFAEAEFWIKRELKLKLGWNENSDAAQQFDQLVRRRFS